MALRSQATKHLLHTYDDERNHRDDEDHVGDEPVAVLGGHTLGVQEYEQSNRQEGQEKGTERGVDDHQQDRLTEGEQDHGRERHPGQKSSEEDTLFGEVVGCLLVWHLADSTHAVCEEMGPTVPGPEHGTGRHGPEADEECPACQEAEPVLHGVYQRQQTLIIAYRRACTEEQLRPDNQHRHHEQGGQRVAESQVGPHGRDPVRVPPAALAHPVRIGGQRVGPAHAADDGEDVDQGAIRYPRDEPEGDLAEGRGEQDGKQYDDPEFQGGEGLHYRLEQSVAAYADDYESRNAVEGGPGPKRKHAGERRVHSQRGGRSYRGSEDESYDEQIDHEVPDRPPAKRTPALQDGLPGGHVPTPDTLGQEVLEDRTENYGPQEDHSKVRPGHQGGDHVPSPNAGHRDDYAGTRIPQPAS